MPSSRTANNAGGGAGNLEMIFQKVPGARQCRGAGPDQQGPGCRRTGVQIEAVGDSQPIFYESMPKGEDGNRRAEDICARVRRDRPKPVKSIQRIDLSAENAAKLGASGRESR